MSRAPPVTRSHPLAVPLLVLLAGVAPAALAAPQQEPPPDEPPPEAPTEEELCDPDDPDDEDCPKIRIIGAGGTGSGPISFEWNGPGRVDYGIYDHGCLDYGDEFRYLVNANRALIGSVAPQAVDWPSALAAARARLADPMTKAGYETAQELAAESKAASYTLGAVGSILVGEPGAALGHLVAGVEKSPDDPQLLFNFAAALNQRDMPNEALAVLARLRALDRQPVVPLGVDVQASLDYLAGYAEMMRGNLAEAKARFGSTIAREPFLNAASHALALVQAHEGNSAAAKITYRDGMWRFKPKFLVVCGADVDEEVRPPVDDMFDTSMGVEGRLVDFWHPDIASDLAPFFEMAGNLGLARLALSEPLKQRMIVMSNNPRFASGTDRPYDAWAEKMSQLIASLDEIEPFIVQQRDAVDRAMRAAARVAGRNQAYVL